MDLRRNLPNITLLSVSGVNLKETIYALWRSRLYLNFESNLLITDGEIINPPKWLTIEQLRDFKLDSIDAYSYFCVFEMHKYVKSKHILLVQADGYALRRRYWREHFLDYDYIGAPWPVKMDSYIDPFGNHQRVGNGGFSLRSRKLLQVPADSTVVWNINGNDFYKHMNYGLQSEDGIICIHNRHVYESAGCVFAPVEVAAQFSTETTTRETVKSFGFHKNLPSLFLRFTEVFYKLVFYLFHRKMKVTNAN